MFKVTLVYLTLRYVGTKISDVLLDPVVKIETFISHKSYPSFPFVLSLIRSSDNIFIVYQ